MFEYIASGLAIGLASFAHCLGMCGLFALHLGQNQSLRANLARQLCWHGGKAATYIFLGALAGFAGLTFASLRLPYMQDVLAYVAGGLMILAGLLMLGVNASGMAAVLRRHAGQMQDPASSPFFSSLLGQLLARPSASSAFVLGLASGFLPCPVVVAALGKSMQSSSVAAGMLTMAGLGVGTLWALLLLSVMGEALRRRLRKFSGPIGGGILILLGLVTVLRASPAFHSLLGCTGSSCRQTTSSTSQTATAPRTTSCPDCSQHP